MDNVLFLAQAAPGAQSLIGALALPVGMLALMYVILIRPQQKQAKELRAFQDGLKAGDRVVTAGGLFGKVVSVDPETAMLEVATRTKIRVARSQIVQSTPDPVVEVLTDTDDSDK